MYNVPTQIFKQRNKDESKKKILVTIFSYNLDSNT